ncbi:MAG: glycosyltransferase family 2 protein [Prevotella sp.]|nr:glycosyltransferase family 2 protein [Prevotella sp.]
MALVEINYSIITINYNGLSDTCALIDSLPMGDDMETIVVDNASHADEATLIEQRYPHVQLVRSDKNLGFAGGNNLGIRAAHGKYLFFLNNDTVMEGTDEEKRHVLRQLAARLESSASIGMVCPKIRFFHGNRPIQYAGFTPLTSITLRNRSIGYGETDHGQYDTPHPTPYAHGAAMMAKREAVEKAGPMPECYFLYYEEIDWSMMLLRAGYEIWYDPACTIFHKESQTTGQASPLKQYYNTRNRLLLAKRNKHFPTKQLSELYQITIVGLRDVLRHLLHRQPAMAKATLSGIADFLKGKQRERRFN